jgi:hypothetical protein
MKTEIALNKDILKITMTIKEEYPELSKYIEELSVTIPDIKSPQINIEHLTNYYNSLNSLVKNYVENHGEIN